jgi:ubiquinone biosynthesis protein COQ4
MTNETHANHAVANDAVANDAVANEEEQLAAVRVAMSGSRTQRLRTALRALTRLMANPDDTTQVLVIAIALNAPHIERIRGELARSEEWARVLADRPRLDSRGLDRDALRRLPVGTLGREYVRFLDENGLNGDFFQPPPGVPEDIAFLSMRLRQSHDVWHPVTGYGPTVRDELALQAFTWAQLDLPHAKLVVLGGLVRFGLSDRGLLRHVVRGYRKGKAARPLGPVYWEQRWSKPIAEVRAELGLEAA